MKILVIQNHGENLNEALSEFLMHKKVEFQDCHEGLLREFGDLKAKNKFEGTFEDLVKASDSIEMKDGRYGIWSNPKGLYSQFGVEHFKNYFGKTCTIDSSFDLDYWISESERKMSEHYDLIVKLFDGMIPELKETKRQLQERIQANLPEGEEFDLAKFEKEYYAQPAFERMTDFQENLKTKNIDSIPFDLDNFQCSKEDYLKTGMIQRLNFDYIIKKQDGAWEAFKGGFDFRTIEPNQLVTVAWAG